MPAPTLLDAIHAAKENERIASEHYAAAARNLSNPLARELFEQLSEFEKYHLEKLAALEQSLQESGNFIAYEGRDFPLPPVFEVKAAIDPERKSSIQIVSEAKELEKQAQAAYASLAEQCQDPQGRGMFTTLAEEERKHFLILSEAYWSLNHTGEWKWSRP